MTISSSKSKEDHSVEDAGEEARTIFVRNLPYSFTDIQLQEVFSEIGPVRRSFTIKEKGSDQHRGFGYVQFAVAEDALRAVKEKDGTALHGRKIMVKVAKRRQSFEARRTKRQSDISKPEGNKKKKIKKEALDIYKSDLSENKQEKERSCGKQRVARTAILGGVLCPKMHESAIEVAKKVGPIDSIQSSLSFQELKGRDTSEPEGNKKKMIKKEASDIYKNDPSENKLEKERSSEKQRVARTVILGGLLCPEMCESAIELAKKVGPIDSIQSSLSSQELKGRGLEKDGCKEGAAAIVFKSVKVASQAVAELHQKSIGNGIVWARQLGGEGAKPRKWRVIIRNLPFNITEQTIQELFAPAGFVWEVKVPRKQDGLARGFAFASFISKASAEKAIDGMNGKMVHKRTIAVDWAVERRAYQTSTSMNAESEEMLQSDPKDDETASEAEEDENQESSFFRDLEDEHTENELLASSEEAELAKRVLNKVVSTSFITNPENAELKLSDIDKDGCAVPHNELKMSQSESKAIIDNKHDAHSTPQGDLKRTVFIKNLPFDVDEGTVKKLFSTFGKVKSMHLVRNPKTKRPKGNAFLEFMNAESVEAACAAASGSDSSKIFAAGIFHCGRKLEVLHALEKTSIASLEKEKSEQRMVDRRNLYLLKEGKIQDGSPAAIGVSEQDMKKRRELEQVKKVKLNSPKFHVSKTRLAVHNLPKSLNEVGLRKLFIDAVKLRATKQEPVIVQAKIARDKAKGKKSKGFAFVEFSKHEHALVALRVLNNNPETFGSERRPIVEFAIENVQLLRKLQEQLSSRGTGANDFRCNSGLKKPQNGVEKPKFEQMISKKKRKLLKKETGRVVAMEHGGPDTGVNKSANSVRKNMSKVVDATLKRKREESGSKEGVGHESVTSFKMQKLSPGKVKRRDLQGFKNKPFSSNSQSRSRGHPNGLKQVNKADSVGKNLDSNLNTRGLPKKPKLARKKKGSKPEVEDKLDKLVAAYREKYFTGKEQKQSTSITATTDFKRWFE